MRLRIEPDGTCIMIHNDAFPLANLGRVSSRRVSNIEFNETSQKWEVFPIIPKPKGKTPGGKKATPLFTHHSRQACVDWEIKHFEKRLGQFAPGKSK